MIAAGSYPSWCPAVSSSTNMARSSPPRVGVPTPSASSNPPEACSTAVRKAMFAPKPNSPVRYSERTSSLAGLLVAPAHRNRPARSNVSGA